MDEYQEALHTTAYHEYTATQLPEATTALGPAGPTGAAAEGAGKDPAEDDAAAQNELNLLEHSSIYFLRHKFPPIFLEFERKAIFEIVLPEMYVTDFAASVKDTEGQMVATQEKLKAMEKQMQLQTAMLQKLLASSYVGQQQQQQQYQQQGYY
jgi:hypothetical protein